MMDLMNGIYLYAQSGLLVVSSLFLFISYGAGKWWDNTHFKYDMKFSLWKLCTSYAAYDTCVSISGEYLESVILTLRASMGIVVLCVVILLVLYVIRFVTLQRDPMSKDHLLHARSVIYLLLMLFLIISIAHSHHCPPCYVVGKTKMEASVSWAWYLSLISLAMLTAPFAMHSYVEVCDWKTGK